VFSIILHGLILESGISKDSPGFLEQLIKDMLEFCRVLQIQIQTSDLLDIKIPNCIVFRDYLSNC